MLIPKRTKYRKQFRGRMKGKAHRGNTVTYGEFGLVATEPSWITSRQIEAARIAMTRYTKRAARSGSRFSQTNRFLLNQLVPVRVPVKAQLNTG